MTVMYRRRHSVPAARGLAATLVLGAAIAAPPAGAADAGTDRLVTAVERIDTIRRGAASPEEGPHRAVARTACRTLSPFVGEPLQRLLDRAYGRLDRHYDRAQGMLETPAAIADFLDRTGAALRAAGLSGEATTSVLDTARDHYRPGGGGAMASYSVNLHATEVSTAVCRAANRLERESGPADARARAAIASGVTVLHGLLLMAALDAPATGEAGPPRAAAGAALGGVVVARGYAALF